MAKKQVHADVFNSFFRIPTPTNAPLRGGLGEMYRFRTRPICQKCGKAWEKPFVAQFPKLESVAGVVRPRLLPNISDQRVMETIMVKVCNIAVGCWADCKCGKNWNMECRANCVALGRPDASNFGTGRPGDCLCLCTCNPKCGNKKQYPCRCGYTLQFHMKACPVADFKRDSSFWLPFARKNMIEAGLRREKMLKGL